MLSATILLVAAIEAGAAAPVPAAVPEAATVTATPPPAEAPAAAAVPDPVAPAAAPAPAPAPAVVRAPAPVAAASPPNAHAPAPTASPFAPLAFLAGHCWKGPFPDGRTFDEHCFEWIYDGRYLRDRHLVTGGPGTHGGESVYWNAADGLHYIYFDSTGGVSQGTVTPGNRALQFPEERYEGGDGKVTVLRSSWRREGEDAYLVVTEIEKDGAWVEAWRIPMKRQ